MEDHLENKTIPIQQLEDYLKLHQEAIVSAQDLLKRKIIKVKDVESMLPKSLSQLHEAITKILTDNDILPSDEE